MIDFESLWSGNYRSRKEPKILNNFDNVLKIAYNVFYFTGINKTNNKSSTLSEIRHETVTCGVDSRKLIFSTKQTILRQNVASGGINHIEIF